MFSNIWKLHDAKNHFSEVVESAMTQGPQEVTRHGRHAVVVLSFEFYQRLVQPKESLVEFLQSSPLKGVKLKFDRSRDSPRNLKL